jgi:hypothetical protein
MGENEMFPSAVNVGGIQQYVVMVLYMKLKTHSWHFAWGPIGLEPNQVGRSETNYQTAPTKTGPI